MSDVGKAVAAGLAGALAGGASQYLDNKAAAKRAAKKPAADAPSYSIARDMRSDTQTPETE